MSKITDEDVSILMNQTNITKSQAREVLLLKDGDLVESLVAVQTEEIDLSKLNELKQDKQKLKEEETDDFIVDTSRPENLIKYREIVDSKDTIYNKIKQEKDERERKQQSGEIDVKPDFSIEELYKLKKGNNSFNSIKVL